MRTSTQSVLVIYKDRILKEDKYVSSYQKLMDVWLVNRIVV